MSSEKELAKQLKNVGPALAKKMLQAGIDSPEKLKSLGAQKAYDLMYANGDSYGDHNAAYLHALEGAIRDCDWSEIPESIKENHRNYAQKLQKAKHSR